MINYYVALKSCKYLFKLFLDFCLLVENPRYNVFTDKYSVWNCSDIRSLKLLIMISTHFPIVVNTYISCRLISDWSVEI